MPSRGPDFPRSPGDRPSLDAVARSDQFIDALATGQPVASGDFSDPGDQALASLLEGWRDELRWPPATGLVSERDAIVALHGGMTDRPRTRRGLAVVGSVAATLLCLGGFGAVVAGAGPGDALYGLRTMVFGEPRSVRDDQVVLAAQTELNQVQELIAQGDWEQAQEKLVAVSTAVQTVNDTDRKQDLVEEWNRLNVKVEKRDPEATLPSPAPNPEVVVPPPVSVTLPVPAEVPATASTPPEISPVEPGETRPPGEARPPTSPTRVVLPPSTSATPWSPIPSTTVPSSVVPSSTVAPEADSSSVVPSSTVAPEPGSSTVVPPADTVEATPPPTVSTTAVTPAAGESESAGDTQRSQAPPESDTLTSEAPEVVTTTIVVLPPSDSGGDPAGGDAGSAPGGVS